MTTCKELKKENDALKQQVNDLGQNLKDISERVGSIRTEAVSRTSDLQFYSNTYDDLISFKKDTKEELKRIGKKLDSTSNKVDQIAAAITALEDYSYQYNIKIVGVPQVKPKESCEETASLCLKIFAGVGVKEISVQDLDIAHRVPRRDNERRSTNKPNPIICKFTRRMAKERVMAMKRNTSELTNAAMGLRHTWSLIKLVCTITYRHVCKIYFTKPRVSKSDANSNTVGPSL